MKDNKSDKNNKNNKNNNILAFDKEYSRKDWIKYFGDNFKLEKGSISSEENIIKKYGDCLKSVIWLGDLNIENNLGREEKVGVYEVGIKNTKLATRVKISKIAVDIIRGGGKNSYGKGIFFVLFSNDDAGENQKQYRISYVKFDKKVGDNFEIQKDISDPKRFTYILGEGVKIKTASSRLTKEAFESVKNIEEAFKIEPVNKEFYNGIKKSFDKIYKNVFSNFKENSNKENNKEIEIKAKEFSLRFLGRALFCWFLREKNLIPKEIFEEKTFERLENKENSKENNYYKEVLDELFFNVLNVKMKDRKVSSEIIKEYEREIPFLNGGLFVKKAEDYQVQNIDNEIIKELFNFFNMYNFTVDESAPFDVEISIDPEMLGRIFENLLAEINPETMASARKETGSFYTPREIVDYMVSESIKLYLLKKIDKAKNDKAFQEKINNIFSINDNIEYTKEEKEEILKAIHEMKILDPACGSGAFPMGILTRVFNIIDKLDYNHEYYKKILLENIKGSARAEFEKLYSAKKFNYAYKLDMLQRTIHGADIQTIAIEISRLRAFLSLIVDEEKDLKEKDLNNNLGIKPLPNLEFNFISANSLISLENKKQEQGDFESYLSKGFIDSMRDIAEDYFNADSLENKEKIKNKFNVVQIMIKENKFIDKEIKNKLLSWNPFENKSAEFFDSVIQFGIKDFDIVIGNPPYGAKLSEAEKKIFKQNYKTAQTIKNKQKGSLDTYTLFIEKGFDLLCKNGNLTYIVPISFTSSDSLTGVHKLIENNCETIRVSSYAERPQPIFENAVVNTSIISFQKTLTPCKNLFSTKMYRKGKNFNLSNLIDNLQFVEVKNLKLYGRIPKISLDIEVNILQKIFKQSPIKEFLKDKGIPIYYRFSGGRYFKVITNYPTNSSAEAVLYFDEKLANVIGCILSSNLSFWFYQIFSDNLNWKSFEIESFTIPYLNFTNKNIIEINKLYKEYLMDIEKNANVRTSSGSSNYKINSFKEYKIVKSKHIIDKIDDLICPLYGLSEEETEFIKNYEIEFRVG